MLQIISAVIKDSEDKTNITLLFANQVKSFCLKSRHRVKPLATWEGSDNRASTV